MQHYFDFIAEIEGGEPIYMRYKGETSRHSKVAKKIKEDLVKSFNIDPDKILGIYLKPAKP